MDKKYADLSPISFDEFETIGTIAFLFFSLTHNIELRKELKLPCKKGIVPFGENDFYDYLIQKIGKEYERKLYKIKKVLLMMERAELLSNVGHSSNFLLRNKYFTSKELTTQQSKNTLWLGEAFGLPYVRNKLKNNVVHITGTDKQGIIHNGTGFLINNRTVLTCKHVVTDMISDNKLIILGREYTYSSRLSAFQDIAVLDLNQAVDNISTFPIFSDANDLDEVLIMGYPSIPGADADYLLTLKGEVNAVVNNYLSNTISLILSSVTRPGTSGGPVISKNGYIVGMVTQFNDVVDSSCFSEFDKKEVGNHYPYYMAMQGKKLFDGIKEIDPTIDISFEDYQ